MDRAQTVQHAFPNGVIHSVPDAGSTVMLLGMALSALGIVRKFRS
jgi:hypothetical protein